MNRPTLEHPLEPPWEYSGFADSNRERLVQQAFRSTVGLRTPCLWINETELKANFNSFVENFPECSIYYALKCNPDPSILSSLKEIGCGFEIASLAELEQAIAHGVPAEKLVCFHPIKSPEFLQKLHAHHVDWLAADCPEELQKIAVHAPGSRVVIRVQIPETAARVPLDRKFGVSLGEQALSLFRQARPLGLNPAGLTIHVGSQCESVVSWQHSLTVYREFCKTVASEYPLQLVSLGGGFPCGYQPDNPSLAEFARAWRELDFAAPIPGCRISVEPGRAIVASAGVLIASVVGLATRREATWVYFDAGVFQGLLETAPVVGGFRFPIIAEHSCGQLRSCRLAGPTCDSLDALEGIFELPELQVGDRVAFDMLGAYSVSMSCGFNGFSIPQICYERTQPVTSHPNNHAHADYLREFDSGEYLRQYYSKPELAEDDRRIFAHFRTWLANHARPLGRMLDVGCGPTVHNSFALAPFVDSIDYADLLPQNLQAIVDWKAQHPQSHDWRRYFREIIRLELQVPIDWPDLDKIVNHRVEQFRSQINELYFCDLLESAASAKLELRPFPVQPSGSNSVRPAETPTPGYDLITTFFCPECVASSVDQWREMVSSICQPLNPGGVLLMALVKECLAYRVQDKDFASVWLNEEIVNAELSQLSLAKLEVKIIDSPVWKDDGFEQIILVTAIK